MTGLAALSAFRSPDFTLLWGAQVISGFGDKITVFALAFVTWELTHSALSTTLSVVIATIPHAIVGFFGGAIADAVGRRRAMIACDLIRALVIGVIPIVLVFGSPLWFVYGLVLIAAVCSAIFNPARMAIVPDLVPPERLGASNSVVFASDRTVEIVGTLVAGVLVALLREAAFYVDAVTFALSALLLGRIAIVEGQARGVSWTGLASDVTESLAIIRDHAVLRANTVFSLIAQLSLPIVNGLTPVLVFREYGLGPEAFGATEAAIAVGAVVAGLVYPNFLDGLKKGRAIVTGFALLGLVLTAIAFAPNFTIVIALFVLVGVTNVVFFVPNMTLIQQAAPAGARARVLGVRFALLNLTWLPAIVLSGSIAEFVSVQAIFAVAGLATVATALIGALFPVVREAD